MPDLMSDDDLDYDTRKPKQGVAEFNTIKRRIVAGACIPFHESDPRHSYVERRRKRMDQRSNVSCVHARIQDRWLWTIRSRSCGGYAVVFNPRQKRTPRNLVAFARTPGWRQARPNTTNEPGTNKSVKTAMLLSMTAPTNTKFDALR
jgi:hypothetical protein